MGQSGTLWNTRSSEWQRVVQTVEGTRELHTEERMGLLAVRERSGQEILQRDL